MQTFRSTSPSPASAPAANGGRLRLGVLLTALLAIAACKGTEPERLTTVAVVSGGQQNGFAGTTLGQPVVIEARTGSGAPMAGIPLTATTTGGGIVAPGSATTGTDGRASFTWTLGPDAGPQQLNVAAAGGIQTSVQVNAALPPVASVTVSLDAAAVQIGGNTTARAVLRDEGGGQLTGRTVTWTSSNPAVATVAGTGATATVTAVAPGTAQITATSETRSGAQTVTVRQACGFPAATAIAFGSTVNASLSATDCLYTPEMFADFYRVEVPTDQTLQIEMNATGFDGLLGLFRADTSFVAQAFGSEARLVFPVAAGTYYVIATALPGVPPVTGAYTLRVAPAPAACQFANAPTLSVPATVTGALSTTDCQVADGSYIDFYRLTLATATSVRIDLRSSAFDAFLVLFDSMGSALAVDDDGAGGTDARLEFTLPAGTYFIGANSYDGGETGTYTLTVTATAAPLMGPTLLQEPVTGGGIGSLKAAKPGARGGSGASMRIPLLRQLIRR